MQSDDGETVMAHPPHMAEPPETTLMEEGGDGWHVTSFSDGLIRYESVGGKSDTEDVS